MHAQASAVLDIEDTPCIGTSMSPGLAPTPGAAPTPDVNPGYSTFRLDVEERTVLQQWRDAREEWKKSVATAARGLRNRVVFAGAVEPCSALAKLRPSC